LGNAVFGRLRTPMVNFFQEWCGNRLAKSLIRPGGNNFAFTLKLAERFLELAEAFEPDFNEMNQQMFSMASALSRFERTGMLQAEDALSIGSVGMAARASGLNRDVRTSHPILDYPKLVHQPVVKHHGDVYSRVQLRRDEVLQSLMYIRNLLSDVRDYKPSNYILAPASGMFALAIIEGWRGEICHCAITGDQGELLLYKIKDPSFHNWQALALAVRNNEISDFPVCNKSFNLSYCGHDL
jgi:Ni,Fe-hydrogenase III large subunit